MSPTLLRLLETAKQRPLTDDEFETMKDVAVLDMLCGYWERAVEPCAVCGVARDLHHEWRAFVDDPSAVAAHPFLPATSAPPAPAPAQTPRVEAPALVALVAATAPAATAAPISDVPVAAAPDAPRRSWWRALVVRRRIGQPRPLNQP